MSLKIGILTNTNAYASLSSTAKWVTKITTNPQLDTYHSEAFEVIGLWEDWTGLIKIDPTYLASVEYWAWPLNELTARTWDHQGDNVLGSSRTNSFNPKNDFNHITTFHNGQITSISLKQILEHIYIVDVDRLYNPVSCSDHRSSILPWSFKVRA
ncbi:MAG: hypothetical protein LBV77_00880 [Candidatus Adiutrix intracellularis]|jgi:hypothetical protein|nr:hypothetical protein [Candidatus Adiutrix intracellularis]